ncbi:hypothetical protein RFI_15048, partial [Reticulomyxa filosa]
MILYDAFVISSADPTIKRYSFLALLAIVRVRSEILLLFTSSCPHTTPKQSACVVIKYKTYFYQFLLLNKVCDKLIHLSVFYDNKRCQKLLYLINLRKVPNSSQLNCSISSNRLKMGCVESADITEEEIMAAKEDHDRAQKLREKKKTERKKKIEFGSRFSKTAKSFNITATPSMVNVEDALQSQPTTFGATLNVEKRQKDKLR